MTVKYIDSELFGLINKEPKVANPESAETLSHWSPGFVMDSLIATASASGFIELDPSVIRTDKEVLTVISPDKIRVDLYMPAVAGPIVTNFYEKNQITSAELEKPRGFLGLRRYYWED